MESFVKWTKKSEEEEIFIEENEREVSISNNEEAISISDERPKLTCYLLSLVLLAIIGGFLFGYDTGVIAGALLVLDEDYDYRLTALQKELLVSITAGAAAVGAICGGPTNEILGRKPTIMIASVFFSLGLC